jgi:hypothetical protein
MCEARPISLLPEPGPHPLFGYNEHWHAYINSTVLQHPLQRASASVARQALLWRLVEESPGQFKWGLFDQTYEQLLSLGVRPLWVVHSAPCWAQSGECDEQGSPGRDHFDEFASFAAQAAQRYPGAVGIEVWNEPNLRKFWGTAPDPKLYGQMLSAVQAAVGAANPAMPVATAGLAPHGGRDPEGIGPAGFLNKLYRTGAPQLADAIGAHPYPFRPYGGRFLRTIRVRLGEIRHVMRAFGDKGKPIWITETGVSTAGEFAYTAAQQAEALVRMYALFRRVAHVPVVIFHRFVDYGDQSEEGGYGVYYLSGQFKPAYCAVAAARELPC